MATPHFRTEESRCASALACSCIFMRQPGLYTGATQACLTCVFAPTLFGRADQHEFVAI